MEPIAQELADAMKYARELAGLTPEQMATELTRLVPSMPVDVGRLLAMEENGDVHGKHLRAAALIAEQPVSVCLRELDRFVYTMPGLERRIAWLENFVKGLGGTPGT